MSGSLLAKAQRQVDAERWRGVTRCGHGGYHAYAAGPCFRTHEQAIAYRDSLDREGVKWRPQR